MPKDDGIGHHDCLCVVTEESVAAIMVHCRADVEALDSFEIPCSTGGSFCMDYDKTTWGSQWCPVVVKWPTHEFPSGLGWIDF